MSDVEKRIVGLRDWNERFLDVAKRLLGHRRPLAPKLAHVESDPEYLSTIVVEFEELTDMLLVNNASFVGEGGSWQCALADVSRVRIAAAAQIDAIILALETPWGLTEALEPLRLVRSALQDLVEGKKNPLMERKGKASRPKKVDKEHDRSWQYLTGLAIDAHGVQSNRRGVYKIADGWLTHLEQNGFKPGADGTDHARRFKDWHAALVADQNYNKVLDELRELEEWPRTLQQVDVFSRNAARHLIALDRVLGPHWVEKKKR